jgi:hypothetical protein
MADLPGGDHNDGAGDRIDTWLGEPVAPLLPPQGAFDQIRGRARRRKIRQVGMSAAGVAVLVVVGVAVPRLIIPHLSPNPPTAIGRTQQPRSHPPTQPTLTPGSREATGSTPLKTTPPATPRLAPAPPNFQPASVTFVGTAAGTATGWVIGQAGTPGHCGPPKAYVCTSIARTDDAGGSWHGVPAPVTGAPNGSRGVGQIRFLTPGDGWAFGPELWATHDGGAHWTRIPTHGMRVVALETSGGRAFAVWARCDGGLLGLAAGCTDFSLYSAAATSDSWSKVPGATGLSLGSAVSSASLVLSGGQVHLFAPDGEVLSGPATGGRMIAATSGGTPAHAPCTPGVGQRGGQPTQALLASTGNGLILLCPSTAIGDAQHKALYYSADGGTTWQPEGTAPRTGIATSLAGTPDGGVVLATDQGIQTSAHPGSTWRAAGDTSLPGGFTYVGMTTNTQGIAIPAQQSLHSVWFTFDGGHHWQASQIP